MHNIRTSKDADRNFDDPLNQTSRTLQEEEAKNRAEQ